MTFTSKNQKIHLLQLELLKCQLKRIYKESKFYREKFKKACVSPDALKSLNDIKKFPFLTREEIQEHFCDILSVPPSKLLMTIQTSGTTAGNPLTMAHTKKDIEMIAETKAKEFKLYGISKYDVAQVALPYGLWQGAWSTHWGLNKIGTQIVPTGAGKTERQIQIMRHFGITVLFATPNYLLRIAQVFSDMRMKKNSLCLRIAVCVAGKLTGIHSKLIKDILGVKKIFIDYGATEFPAFCAQCPVHLKYHHIWPDNYLVEIVDPDTLTPLPEGSKGELVVTSLKKEALPLIRYLSRDITRYTSPSQCACGLDLPKIDADIDRKDFMIKVRGLPLFPGQVEKLIEGTPGLTGRLQIVVDKRIPRETLSINLERDRHSFVAAQVENKIREYISKYIGIKVNTINFVPEGTFADKFRKTIVLK